MSTHSLSFVVPNAVDLVTLSRTAPSPPAALDRPCFSGRFSSIVEDGAGSHVALIEVVAAVAAYRVAAGGWSASGWRMSRQWRSSRGLDARSRARRKATTTAKAVSSSANWLPLLATYFVALLLQTSMTRVLRGEGGVSAVLPALAQLVVFGALAVKESSAADGYKITSAAAPLLAGIVALEVATSLLLPRLGDAAIPAGFLSVLLTMLLSIAMNRKSYVTATWVGAVVVILGSVLSAPLGATSTAGKLLLGIAAFCAPSASLILKENFLQKTPQVGRVFTLGSIVALVGLVLVPLTPARGVATGSIPSVALIAVYCAVAVLYRFALLRALQGSSAVAIQFVNMLAVPLGTAFLLLPAVSWRVLGGLGVAAAGVLLAARSGDASLLPSKEVADMVPEAKTTVVPVKTPAKEPEGQKSEKAKPADEPPLEKADVDTAQKLIKEAEQASMKAKQQTAAAEEARKKAAAAEAKRAEAAAAAAKKAEEMRKAQEEKAAKEAEAEKQRAAEAKAIAEAEAAEAKRLEEEAEKKRRKEEEAQRQLEEEAKKLKREQEAAKEKAEAAEKAAEEAKRKAMAEAEEAAKRAAKAAQITQEAAKTLEAVDDTLLLGIMWQDWMIRQKEAMKVKMEEAQLAQEQADHASEAAKTLGE